MRCSLYGVGVFMYGLVIPLLLLPARCVRTVSAFYPFLLQTRWTPRIHDSLALCHQLKPHSIPLETYLENQTELDLELKQVLVALSEGCAEISRHLALLPLMADSNVPSNLAAAVGNVNVQGELQKPMDVVSNEIMKNRLQPIVAAMASEEEEEILLGAVEGRHYEVAFDPLDGSSNLDVNIPTG